MMGVYEELGVKRYINAHDTYTVYGGSRMAAESLDAMREAAESFVDIEELQVRAGDAIARMTHNEAAYITNGASGGVLLAACVCMTGGDPFRFSRLPDTTRCRNEIVIMRCQRNAYDMAITASGATVVEIGDADETLPWELEGVLGERTAAVFYFASSLYAKAAMKLEDVIRMAHARNIPVVVDAAAQLPPAENLWRFTRMGADMVLFSGGKTLCGPQASGLIVGTVEMIARCRALGAPVHGICRSSKVGREEMAALYVAVKQYVSLDHGKHHARLESIVKRLMDVMHDTGAFHVQMLDHGPVGQTYPRAHGRIIANFTADELAQSMRMLDPGIYIGVDRDAPNAVYLSPLNLSDEEVEMVAEALKTTVAHLLSPQPQEGSCP